MYTYSGKETDGHFYPLHVAAEAGHKQLTLLLIKAGADITLTDMKYLLLTWMLCCVLTCRIYRGHTAEEVSNGEAIYAFYEIRGMKYEPTERYEGGVDAQGKWAGVVYKPVLCMHVCMHV